MIPDRFFFPLALLVVAALIGLALVFPQGAGYRSPGPFGHDLPPAPAATVPPAPAGAPASALPGASR